MQEKKVLLIAGGGTLGTYCSEELLSKGYKVDIICLEDKTSDNPNLRYFKFSADYDTLKKCVTETHYDGIINFIHYPDVENYKPIHKLLTANTSHLIFLSSYRIYSDGKVITEESPRLLDTSTDREFLKDKTYYALTKAVAEDYMRSEKSICNWTAVRPVISFSSLRFDIVTQSDGAVINCLKENKPLLLPEGARKKYAGLDWAGNTGKIIANILFKKDAFTQSYTVSSAPNLTWEEVANIYTEVCNLKVKWIPTEEYIAAYPEKDKYILLYDRLFDRYIDNSKVLKVTGLTKDDFKSVKYGVITELKKCGLI